MAASGFNLTAQINLRGPNNIGVIVSDIKKQIGSINANLNVTISANAAKNVTQLNAGLQVLNQTFKSVQTSATSAAAAIAQFNAAVGNTKISSYQNNINSSISATQKLGQSQAQTAKAINTSSSEMEEFGKQAGLAVRRFAAFSAVTSVIFAVTNSVSKGISSFIDFDKELVRLQQVTGESASGLNFLQNTITSLSTNLGVGSAELLNVSSTLAQAGLSARDTEKALKALALSSLAPSFDSMNETVEGSIALMRQFGIGAGDLTKALGSVNAVAAKFAVEASDIIAAIQRTGGVFASASKGVSEGTQALNEFIAVFTSVRATTRESAETIATGLRTIFTRVQREGTIDALKEYGVNLTDLDGKFVGAYKAVELLSRGLNSIDPRDLKFSRIVEELGGFRQIGKVIPLIQEFGTAQQALSVAQSGQNSLTTDAVKAQLSLANQISKVREEFLALFREIGSSNTFQNMATGALQVVKAIVRVADAVKGILPVLAVLGISKGLDSLIKFGSGLYTGIRKGPDNKSGGFAQGGPVSYFAAGGLVPGSGNGDSVSARLTPGEFVMRKSAVSSIGAGNLSNMNQGGLATIDQSQGKRINKYAGGNIVTQIGGVPATTTVVKGKDNTTVGFENDYYNINADKKIIKIAYNKKDKKFRADKKLIDISDVDNLIYNNPKSFETWENIAAKVLGATKLNEQDPNYPIDLIKGKKLYDAKFRPESGFKEKDAALKALSHRLEETNSGFKYNQSKKTIKLPKFLGKSTRPERDDFQDPGSITYVYPEFKDIPTNLKSIEEGMRTRRYQAENLPDEGAGYFARKAVSAIGDSKYISGNKDIINLISMPKKNKSSGGMIQKFGIGGEAKAIRRIGIIDSDVLRQTVNAEKVSEGMKLIGADSIKDYTIQLAKLGVQKRKSGDLKKFRVIAGAAGSGKSSLATGVSANDSATLRQTVRSQIISPQDLDNVDEVLTITANVSDAKLEAYLRDADRTYTLSSDTKAEQNLVTDNKDSRDVTGKLLYDREPGRTKGVSPDFGIEQATLMDELGSKNVVLGRKEDAQGNLTNRFRRKRGDELPEIVQAEGFYTGGFSPPTRGHRGAFDTLLENVIAKNPNATIKDILVSVAPNVAMVEGKEGLAHAARYGIFDADFRSLLAGINFKGAMISSDTQPTGGILPKVMEVPGENNRRKFARLKGAMAVTSGKEKGALGKYDRAGIEVTDIPRIEDISATTVRELLFSQNYTELDKIVNPEIGAILKGNQPQLKNRSVMVPVLLEEINKIAEINKILANQKADNILANAPGGPYTNVTKKLKAEHPEIAAQVKSIRDERDAFKKSASGAKSHSIIRQLASTYPEIYGIDPSRRAATTASTISAEDARSHLGDRVKSLLPEGTEIPDPSLLESIKQNVIKQLAAPKGAGTLPTDSKTISSTFFNAPIPSDPTFGMFAGKTVDPGIVKKVWRQTYAGLSPDKEASYAAVKTWLETQYNARTGAKTEELSQAIEESKMVGLVGMLPIGHERLSGPFTWMLGKNAAGDDVSVTASILERGLGKKYEEEVKAAQQHAEQGSESLAAGLSSKMKKRPESLRSLDKNQLETLGQGNIEGAYIEQALARLWANLDNVSTRTRPIDYPDGLGESAELFPGISPTMPTEVKRTINSDSRGDAIKEFQRYFRLINGVPEPKEPKEAKEEKTQKEVVKALAQGGEVQNFMAGGVATKTKKPKEVFGTGETAFPSRISKKYAEEQYSASERSRAKLTWDKNPKDERIMIDDEKVKESFQQPFDRERFASSFKEKISRDSLFERMSDFAKFVGLPQEDLTTALPLQLDFGATKRGGGLGMFAAAQFEKGAVGIRPYDNYDLSKFGYGEKQKQEAYGLKKLIETKEKEIAKIVKTPTQTFDDGSFSFDREAYSRANIELDSLKNKSFTLTKLKSDAEKEALAEQNATSSASGRGTISFASSMGYSSDTKNSTLYHEMTHQLFQGLRKKSADSFDKYRDRVSSLFSGDNDDLADAFDSLTAVTAGGGYSSADVVYGRSYKSNNLSQILSSYYRQNLDFSRGTDTIPQDTTKNLASLSNQSTAAKRAREYRPINPKVNEALLQGGSQFGMTQEKINRMEDNGKEEFLTTLIEKAPQLDQNLQGILDSTLTELLSGAGIQRQKFAVGGKASRGVDLDKEFIKNPIPSPFNKVVSKKLIPEEAYKLEKSSGLSRGQFQQAYDYAKVMDFTREEFEKDLARRRIVEEQKSQIKTNPSDMAKQLMPETKPLRPDLRALADSLQDNSNDIGYRPSALERIAQARNDISNATRGFAVGGEVETSSDLSNWENVQQDPSFQQAIADFERLYGRNNVMNKLQFDAYDKDNSKTPKIGMDQGLSGASYKVTPGLIEQKGPEYQDIIANRVAGYRKANKVQQAAIEKNKIKSPAQQAVEDAPFLRDARIEKALETQGKGMREYEARPRETDYAQGGFRTRKFAGGGVAEPEQKKEKEYGYTGLYSDTGAITAMYFGNKNRTGSASAYKFRDNLYYMGMSSATSGYGPRLYDLVMEAATEQGSMLTSDRNVVSGAAKGVWEYYFKNRSDVNKTPLDPKDWTINKAMIDPALQGDKSTWPPKTDPAWVLQTGYSKSPSLIKDPSVKRLSKEQKSNMDRMAVSNFMSAKIGNREKFAGGGAVSLYHGSNTGVNDNVLKSFREKGALSDVAQGYGQGAGFYVYSGREKAKEQAMMRVKGGLGSFAVVSGDTAGKPMVLTFKEMLEPETWDLDYELNKGSVVKWLVENYDKIKDKVAPGEKLTGIKDVVSPDSSKGIMSHGIRVESDTGSRKTIYSGTDSDLREGQLVGQIMSRLQAHDPKMVGDFENTFFKSPSLSSGDWDNLALKYVGSKPLKPINIETFADGGNISKFDRGGHVPAMVSTGEAFVPPATARSIGYGKLAAMNQADRNGMRSFASGGISVFKGPGTGTSDSIGPIALPVGSFVIRQAATKALGLSSGGSVGIQKFATGSPGGVGTAPALIIQEKEKREAKIAELGKVGEGGLRDQASKATGSARILLESKIKDIEKELTTLDASIGATSGEFDTLSSTVDTYSTIQKQRQESVSKAQVELVEKMKNAGNIFAGGREFKDLDETERQQAVDEARSGSYKNSSGTDLFGTENKKIDKTQKKLDNATRVKEDAETERTAKFGDAKTIQQVKNRSLTSTELQEKKQQDQKFFEYKGKKEGTTAASYKYGLAKQLGQAAYQMQDPGQYAGRKQEMAYDLSTKRNKLSGLGSTIEQAKADVKAAGTGGPDADAAKTRLADATSRLDAEVEAIAKSMRDLNPTLENVDENARAVANALASGDLDAAQKKMIESLGEVPEKAEAMQIAMQRMADQLGVDVGTLEREFGSGAGAKTLERQQFIASKEGQRFGVAAEIAPDLAKRFSESRAGKFGGNVSDFISGKGGAYSQTFAKMGGMTTLSMGIAAAPGLAQKAMGDPTSSQGAATYAGAQGAASTLGAGLQLAAKTGPFAPFVAAGAAVAALATAFKDGRNAFIEFEKNLRSQNIQRALEGTASGFEALGRDAKDLAAQRQVSEKLVTAGKEAEASTNIDQTVPKAFFVNLLDSMGIMGGGKDSVDRSKILEKEGTGAYLSSLDMFGGASQRRAYTAAMIPEQAQSNAKQYSEIATQSKQLIEVKGRAGQTFSDVKASPEYANLAKNIALSNTAVQEQILAIDNSTSYRTAADRESAKEAIIRAHADKEISKMMLSSDRARAAADLEKTSRSFTMSFKRLFENMEASVNRTNAELAKFNNALDSNVAAMTGSGKNSSNTELESLEVLKNPRAYSQDRVDSANNKAGSIFGFDSQIVSGLSGLGEKLETSLLSSINSTISKNPGASDTKIAMDLEKSIGSQVGELSLPKDLSKQLSKEIASAVGDLRKEGTKKIDIDQLTDRIPGLKNAIDSAKNAQNASVAALQNWQNNLNNYSEALNRAADMEMQAADLRRKANDIAIEGAMSLGQALGKNYGADIGTKLRDQKVGGMAGGLTSPTDIRNRMDDLNSQRQRQEAEVKLSKNESVGGNKNSIQNVINNEKALKQTNNQLRQTSAALKVLAESGSAASNALNAIQEAQRKQQGKVGLIEKLVTSGPEELFNFNKSLTSLQRMSGGQVVPQTAEERKDTLSTLNDITPLLGDGKQANNIKANVLESMLKDSGVGVSTQFKEILNALRNPESDNETQQAIKVYQEAIAVQTQANEALAQINTELANDIANTTADAIKTALTGITLNFNQAQLDDIAKGVRAPSTVAEPKALGGLIYAAAGTMVDFQPQGTDTVPAMLTPGEFVVNRTATANNLGLLHSINSGKTSYYADGGYVSNISKSDFGSSGTTVTDNEYPVLGTWNNTKMMIGYDNVQAMPFFQTKQNFPLSELANNSFSYKKGSSKEFSTDNYILGAGQPISATTKTLRASGGADNRLYSTSSGSPGSVRPASMMTIIDADNAEADVLRQQSKKIEKNKIEAYQKRLEELESSLPSSFEVKDDFYNMGDGPIFYPTIQKAKQLSGNFKPKVTVVNTSGGGFTAQLQFDSLAKSLPDAKFGPFYGDIDKDVNQQSLPDYYIEGSLYKSLFASNVGETSSKMSSIRASLGVSPFALPTTDQQDYVNRLFQIFDRVKTAKKNLLVDEAKSKSDKDTEAAAFYAKLDKIYKGTIVSEVFKGDSMDLEPFTSEDALVVYSTSLSDWNNKYIKDIEDVTKHTDKFRDLEYFGKDPAKRPINIAPEENGLLTGETKEFAWIGGGDFKFAESAQKAMNEEVEQNKDKLGGVGSSKQNTGNILLQQPDVKLPYDLSYLEYSNSTGIGGSSSIAANEKVHWVQPLETDLSVFSNLKEKPSKLFVRDAGMKNNEPISQVRDLLNADPAVNKYFDSLKQHGIEDPRTKKLETGINDKTVDITADFLKPTALGDFTNFKEAYNGTVSLRIGDYLKASAKAISGKLTKDAKAQANKKMKNSTNDAESLEDKQYPGASLAMILGAQSLFSSGGQFELPDILGNGWFHPTLDSQYKSIYDVDPGTLRAYMGNLSQVFDNKVQRMNQIMSRIPDSYRDQAVAGLTNLYGATNAFKAISTGDTSSLMGLFGKADFQNQTPQGDPAMNRKAVELFQSLGMGVRMEGIGTEQFTKDQQRQIGKDLEGVKINAAGSSTNETKDISPEQLPKTYQELFNLAINPYNEFPNRDSRKGLIQKFIDAVPTARDPGTNSLLFGPQTGVIFSDALTNLQKWYGGGQGTPWLGSDYLTEQGTVDVTDPFSHEPKSYDTRLSELDTARDDALQQRASAGYEHIGGKQKFNTDLPNFDYYKNKAPLYKQTGGMIYASQGTLVNFEPRGTDTVPAMLTPGEFVINRQATQEHLPLLQAINNGGIKGFSEGGVVYFAGGGVVYLSRGGQPTKEQRQAQFQERKQARDQQLSQAREQRSEYNRQRKAGLEAQREAAGYRNGLLREGRSVDEANQMAGSYAQEAFQNNYQKIKDQERAKFEELEQRKAKIQEDKVRAADPVLQSQDLLARYEGRLTDIEIARSTDDAKGLFPELDVKSGKTNIKKGSRYANRPRGEDFRDSLTEKDRETLDKALSSKKFEQAQKKTQKESEQSEIKFNKEREDKARIEESVNANLDAARSGSSFRLRDTTGKFSTTGTVLSRTDKGVSVKKEDGKIVFVPMSKLDTDTIIAVNAQTAHIEVKRKQELEEASRSQFASIQFMEKEAARNKKLEDAGVKDTSTETDILRRKKDSGIKLTKEEELDIKLDDKEKVGAHKKRLDAEERMAEEKRKQALVEQGERRNAFAAERQGKIDETRSRLDMIVNQELATIKQLEEARKDSGWFGSLNRGVTGVDNYELQIQNAKNKLGSARYGLSSLADAIDDRTGVVRQNNSQDSLNIARGLAGLPNISITSFKPKDPNGKATGPGLFRTNFDNSFLDAEEAALTATRDISIDVIAGVGSLGVGGAVTQGGKIGIRAAATRGLIYGGVSGGTTGSVRAYEDVTSGRATLQEGITNATTETLTSAVMGGGISAGATAIGKGAQAVARNRAKARAVQARAVRVEAANDFRIGQGLQEMTEAARLADAQAIADKVPLVDPMQANAARSRGILHRQNVRAVNKPIIDQNNSLQQIDDIIANKNRTKPATPKTGTAKPQTTRNAPTASQATTATTKAKTSTPLFSESPDQIAQQIADLKSAKAAEKAGRAAKQSASKPKAKPAVTESPDQIAQQIADVKAAQAAAKKGKAPKTAAAPDDVVTPTASTMTEEATTAVGTTSPSLAFKLGAWLDQTTSGGKLSPKTASNIAGYGKLVGDKIPLVRPASNLVGFMLGKVKKNKLATLATGATAYNYLSPDKKEEPQKKASGGIVYASNGALIEAKQFGSDSVPAMLTPGEFVVNRQSTQRFMPVLNAINSGHYSHGGAVKYLANGGVVQPKYLEEAGMVNNNITNMSSQSGVLTSTSANQSQPVMAKPAWVDEFASRLEQGGTTLLQGASQFMQAGNTIQSGAQEISNTGPLSLKVGGSVDFGNANQVIEKSLAGMLPIAQSAGQMGREGARQDSKKQWENRTGDAQA